MNDTASTQRTEVLTAGPAEGIAGLLGVELPDLTGDGLPPLWHWVYLLDRPAQSDLGPDGHPLRGVVPVPPGPGLRRMWAGGRVSALRPLVVGAEATRTSRVLRSEAKVGRSGAMTFVTVRHEVAQDGRVVVEEDQDIVYREPTQGPSALAPAAPAPAAESGSTRPTGDDWRVEVTPTLLARYSALTYNAHRIHYDRDFARDVEGYPGLLVHGPLQALAMAEAARRLAGRGWQPVTFGYRLLSPLFDHQGMSVSAVRDEDAIRTAVRDDQGRDTATGQLTIAGPEGIGEPAQ